LSPPNLLRRSEFDDGEARVRRRAATRPAGVTLTYELQHFEAAAFRRWVQVDLDAGRLWFNLDAFVDDRYQTVEARMVPEGEELYALEYKDDQTWRLSLIIEVRELPFASEEEYAVSLLGGGDRATSVIAGLHQALHEDLANIEDEA
jgi:hypothetical protein